MDNIHEAVCQYLKHKYQRFSLIGRGSQGVIFKAQQRSTGHWVSIKTLSGFPGPLPDYVRQPFVQEVSLIANLRHPHMVSTIDHGHFGPGWPYHVFEYLDGYNLFQYQQRHLRLPLPTVHRLFDQLLDVMVALHRLGIVHGDLKPANLMVVQPGSVPHIKVIDFGVGFNAYALDYAKRPRSGTLNYQPHPSRFGDRLSPQHDLYAWGIMLLECLRGKPLFASHVPEIVRKKQMRLGPQVFPRALRQHPLLELLTFLWEESAPITAEALQAQWQRIQLPRWPKTSVKKRAAVPIPTRIQGPPLKSPANS